MGFVAVYKKETPLYTMSIVYKNVFVNIGGLLLAVSIRDVAKLAGVTIGTVSRALNGYEDIRPETRQKILETVRELGYVPNVSARSLSAKRPPNVALIISGLLEAEPKDNLSYLLLQGIYEYAQASGLELAVYATDSKEQQRKSYAQFCKEHTISGAILSGITTDDAYLAELVEDKIPCVAVDVPLFGKRLGWVSIDNLEASRRMVAHLFEQGHRNIVIVSGKKNAAVNLERMAGAYEAFAQAGVTLDSDRVLYAKFSEKLAYEAVKEYLEKTPNEARCTAFCCFSDIMALGTIAALREAGFRVPEDFAVTGFDGLALTEYTVPAITTVWQDMRGMGYEAVKLLDGIMRGKQGCHKLIPYELLLRGSSGAG